MIRISLLAAAGFALALPAFAQSLPPANAKPLSQIILNVEKSLSPRAITEVEWDDDGYWDIRYRSGNNNIPARVRVDPMTGETWSRRR